VVDERALLAEGARLRRRRWPGQPRVRGRQDVRPSQHRVDVRSGRAEVPRRCGSPRGSERAPPSPAPRWRRRGRRREARGEGGRAWADGL